METKKILIGLFNKTQTALNTMGYQARESMDFMLTFLFWKFLSDTTDNSKTFNDPGVSAHFNSVHRKLGNKEIHEQIALSLHQWSKANSFANLLELNFRGLGNQFLPNIMQYWVNVFDDLPENFWTKENIDLSMEAMGEFINTEYPDAYRMFTPRAISQLIANALVTKDASSMYDPFCQTGGMLMLLEDYIKRDVFTQGITPDRLAWKFSRIHAIMRESNAIIRLESIDELSNPARKFDLIAANPPFSQKMEIKDRPSGSWSSQFPSTKGTVRFITHCLDHLSDKGHMAIIVPTGFLSGAGHVGKLRERITRENLLEAVIELPSKVFYGTGVSTALLLLSKTKKTNQTIFINAADFGERQRDRTILTDQEVTTLSEIIKSFKGKTEVTLSEKVTYKLSTDQILENNSNWLFVEPAKPIIRRSLQDVLAECREIEVDLRIIEDEIEREMRFNQ